MWSFLTYHHSTVSDAAEPDQIQAAQSLDGSRTIDPRTPMDPVTHITHVNVDNMHASRGLQEHFNNRNNRSVDIMTLSCGKSPHSCNLPVLGQRILADFDDQVPPRHCHGRQYAETVSPRNPL